VLGILTAPEACRRAAVRLWEEAAALEAEHQTHHGALPTGHEDG
jgi:hypothetical protein